MNKPKYAVGDVIWILSGSSKKPASIIISCKVISIEMEWDSILYFTNAKNTGDVVFEDNTYPDFESAHIAAQLYHK